jgi:hypothetical protein
LIVVFASAEDASARRLVQRWATHGAVLMTPADLSRAGWRSNSRHPAASRFVASGRVHDASEIDGVLIRSATIAERELTKITPSDRTYVAAEMNAFLVYWFATLGRPVLNRPTPRSLGGPGWYPEHWIHCAASVGLTTPRVTRTVSPEGVDPAAWPDHATAPVELTIVGERAFGAAESDLIGKARALARAAGVGLVTFGFDGPTAGSRFLVADPFPALEDAEVSLAVLDHLTAARRAS